MNPNTAERIKGIKVTKLYNKLSLIRDRGIPILTPFIDWIRDLLWNKYYFEKDGKDTDKKNNR